MPTDTAFEPDLNPTYQDLAEHYGAVIIPARVRKGRDKAKVESGVKAVGNWILARLRNRTFFRLAELNRAIGELLSELNGRIMQHLGKSRRELFEELDRPRLRPLPSEAYQFAVWKKAGVHIDYHVEFGKHYYRVPFELIGDEVFIRASERTVEVFHKGRWGAAHRRRHHCLFGRAAEGPIGPRASTPQTV